MRGHDISFVIYDETANATSSYEDDDHITCCENDDLALCGADATNMHWLDPDAEINCATCLRLELADAEWLDANCDNDARCPHCPMNVLGGAS
jgi:hypothetical protein